MIIGKKQRPHNASRFAAALPAHCFVPRAAYELDQLCETFADVAETLPKYRDLSILDLSTSTVKEPLAAFDRAIRAKDGNQFTAAYGQLTASCTACHQSYDRAVVVIQPPTVAAFPDQDFRPSAQ